MARAAQRRRTPRRTNQSGVHILHSHAVVRALVRSAELGEDDHVVDLGAGPGALTAALAAIGARVTAVERDEAFVRTLRRRFADRPRVRVVHGDLLQVPIPRAAKVVANIPFGTSSALLARLLNPAGRLRPGADLVVERGFALRASAPVQRSAEAAWRSARYEIRLAGPIPRASFGPPPAVDAAHLRIRPRRMLDSEAEARLRALLAAAYDGRVRSAGSVARRVVGPARARRGLLAAGVDAGTPATLVPAWAWGAVAEGG